MEVGVSRVLKILNNMQGVPFPKKVENHYNTEFNTELILSEDSLDMKHKDRQGNQ